MAASKIMLIAGEPSGDLLGAALMQALRQRLGNDARFIGVGGERMVAAGLASAVPLADLAVMGLAEVLPRIPRLLGHLATVARLALAERPDAVVTIDAPGFNFRLARRLTALPCPLIHYVAPSVWAWRPGRARKIAPLFDHLLTLLPFEPPYFERVGLAATFVGHPVIERTSSDDQGAFRIAHQVPDDQTIIAVLPGSRQNETSRLLAPFGAALAIVAHRRPLVAVVPTVANVASQVRAATAAWPVRTIVVEDERGKGQAFAASRAALAASGTVALELARAGVPNVIAYRLHPLTYLIARRLVKIRYVSLVNLLLDQPVVPELLQGECQPERLAMELERLIEEGAARVRQQRAFGEALARLRPAGGGSPSEAAAATVLEAIAIGRRRPQ